MKFKQVTQLHTDGCFVACVAMILGKSYKQALRLIHPKGARNEWNDVCMPPEESIEKLPSLGIKIKNGKTRTIRHLRRDALLLIRWRAQPELMHAVVYDASKKKFWDPIGKPFPKYVYERQLDTVLYIDRMKPKRRAA